MLISLLARILIWILIGNLLWYLLVKLIPKTYLTWFGGVIPLLLLVLIVAKPESTGLQVAWQLLSLPLTPLGLSLILLGLAFKDGKKKVNVNQVLTATLILTVSSLPLVAFTLIDNLEGAVFEANRYRLEICRNGPETCPVDALPTANEPVAAIVVFNEGRNHYWPGMQTLSALNQLERMVTTQVTSTQLGAQIYRDRTYLNSNTPLMVVTGGSPESDRSDSESQEAALLTAFLTNGGVSASQIRILSTGLAIRSTVNRVDNLLTSQGTDKNTTPTRVAVVAPALLLRRAGLAFSRSGYRVVAYASESYRLNAPEASGLLADVASVIPNIYALELTSRAIAEHLTTIYYFLRDWLPSFDVLSEGAVEVGDTQRL